MKRLHEWTVKDVENTEPGTLIYTEDLDAERNPGVARFQIVRGETSLCAYLSVPAEHRLQQLDWDSDEVHGGIGFDGESPLEPGRWAWGWSYDHLGDGTIFPAEVEAFLAPSRAKSAKRKEAWGFSGVMCEYKWLPLDVLDDAQEAIREFRGAVAQAEASARRWPEPMPRREGRTARGRREWETRRAERREAETEP